MRFPTSIEEKASRQAKCPWMLFDFERPLRPSFFHSVRLFPQTRFISMARTGHISWQQKQEMHRL